MGKIKKGAEYAGHDVKKGAKSVFNKMKKALQRPERARRKGESLTLIKWCWGIGLYWLAIERYINDIPSKPKTNISKNS